MKKRTLTVIVCSVLLYLMLPVTAFADMGPKPSVDIEFTVPEGVRYYATLLSERKTTGPASVWDGDEAFARYHEGDEDYEIWLKFVAYEDADGYYFLQELWDCTDSHVLHWGYYPPSPFKVLCYFPDTDTFAVSDIYERYAFDSFYALSFDESDITGGVLPAAEKNYDYTWEIISLLIRIVLTIAIEIAVALLFGYRNKKQLRLLAVVNVATQVLLNIALALID